MNYLVYRSAIKASLIDAIYMSDDMSDEKSDKKILRWQKVEQFLRMHEYMTILKKTFLKDMNSIYSLFFSIKLYV